MHGVEGFKRIVISAVAVCGIGNWFCHVRGTKQAEGVRKYYRSRYIVKADIHKKNLQF
jgi:hypothetical protein